MKLLVKIFETDQVYAITLIIRNQFIKKILLFIYPINFRHSSMSSQPSLDFTKLYCQLHPCELVTNYCNDGTLSFYHRKMPRWIVCQLRLLTHRYALTNWNCPSISKCQRHFLHPPWLTQISSLTHRRRQMQIGTFIYLISGSRQRSHWSQENHN